MSDQQTTRALYRLIARMKGTDACIQAVCFLATICMYAYVSCSGILILACAQCFSAVFWLFTLRKDTIRMKGSTAIRVIFIILASCLAFCFWLGDTLLLYFTGYIMLVTGSLISILYFIATLVEISFYHRLSREYIG